MKNLGSIVEALVLSGAIALSAAACGGGDSEATEGGGGEATQGGEQSCSGDAAGGEHSCSGQDAAGGDAPADAAGGDAPAPDPAPAP